MVCYPEVQKEAQAELDRVLNGRLPEHGDIPSLPYLSALIQEVYRYAATFRNSFLHANRVSRWEPVAPLSNSLFLPKIDYNKLTPLFRQGIPHQSTRDDVYNGYHIPVNSVVIPNQW